MIAASLVAVASALTSSLTRPGAFARRHQRAALARRRPPRAAPTMLFLDECVWKENALAWAKETSRTKFERPAVVALFDRAETCVYVGAVDDAAFAVAALAAKHGTETIAKLKREVARACAKRARGEGGGVLCARARNALRARGLRARAHARVRGVALAPRRDQTPTGGSRCAASAADVRRASGPLT